jgi:type I restriction enzyme S subunit
MARLGDVATFIRGTTFKPADVVPPDTPGTVRCLRTKNVQTTLDLDDVWAIDQQLARRRDQTLRFGDILVSSANSWNLVGKCSWIPKLEWPATFGGFVTVLRAKDCIDSRYLYHWFSSPRTQALARSFGQQTTNISNLNLNRCLDMELPLPPITQQRRIADILDGADELRAKRRQALARLDDLTQAIFFDMFGRANSSNEDWPVRRLGDVADFFAGSSLPDGEPFCSQPDGHFLIKVSDMNRPGNEVRLVVSQLWRRTPGARAATCPAGSLVIPKRGAAIATNKKRITTRASILDPNLMAITPKPADLDLSYLYQWFAEFDLSAITSGSSVPQLNKQDLRPIPIVIPPIGAQREFALLRARIGEIGESHRSQITQLDTLFSSLQQRAFAGQL